MIDDDVKKVVEGGFQKIPEAASFLGISRSKLYQLLDQGALAYAKFGRSRRIPRQALLDYAQRQLVRRAS
jgi:excisionase family DNA binding protein